LGRIRFILVRETRFQAKKPAIFGELVIFSESAAQVTVGEIIKVARTALRPVFPSGLERNRVPQGQASKPQNSRSWAWLILIRATATPKFGFVLAKLALVAQHFSDGAGRARKLVRAYW
jgi:hypothetical protein